MKIAVECDSILQLKTQLEEALLGKTVEMLLERITKHISDQHQERDVSLRGLQQCTDAIRVMIQRIPKAHKTMAKICEKTEELLDLFDATPVDEHTIDALAQKELSILKNDIRTLFVIMEEES